MNPAPERSTQFPMIPGPVQVSEEVLAELGTQIEPHYGPQWTAFYGTVLEQLKRVFRTTGELFIIPGSGSSTLDAAVGSAIGVDDHVVVFTNGLFGDRLAEIAQGYSKKARVLSLPIDRPIDPDEVRQALDKDDRPALMLVVHSESSSGLLNPIEEIACVATQAGVPIMVDAISSLGGIPLHMDAWGVDICVSASQKCLGAPPGVGIVAVGEQAWKQIYAKRVARGWYLSLQVWKHYSEMWKDWHPHPVTMPVQIVRALDRALREVLSEGLEVRWSRHAAAAQRLRTGMAALGFRPVFAHGAASPTVISLHGRDDLPAPTVVDRLRTEQHIDVAGGMGTYRGKVFRIGNMGIQATEPFVTRLLCACERLLQAKS